MAIRRRFARWFLFSGGVGVLMALLLYILGAFTFSRAFVVHVSVVLCPEMVLGLGLSDPPTPGALALLLAFVFGTNFVLYGLIGLLLCGVWTWLRRRPATTGDSHS